MIHHLPQALRRRPTKPKLTNPIRSRASSCESTPVPSQNKAADPRNAGRPRLSQLEQRKARCSCPWLLAMVTWVSLTGCGVGNRPRGYPLHGDANLPLSAVARLHGYVEQVSGEPVTQHGHLFELLPGCHVLGTPRTWGGSGTYASATAETGHLRRDHDACRARLRGPRAAARYAQLGRRQHPAADLHKVALG